MITVLYENEEMLAVVKPVGVVSERRPDGKGFPDMLEKFCWERGYQHPIYPVHRLDKDVSGVMLFAKTVEASSMLTAIITSGDMEKEYLAVVEGCPQLSQDRLFDLLYHDQAKNKTYVVKRPRRGVRDASLSYEVMQQDGETALLHIWLHTGRTHQIRVQFASRKHPVVGDRRYGSRMPATGLALFSHRITFVHPHTRKIMSFCAYPTPEQTWERYAEKIQEEQK